MIKKYLIFIINISVLIIITGCSRNVKLFNAIKEGNLHDIKTAVENGADLNARSSWYIQEHEFSVSIENDCETPMISVIRQGRGIYAESNKKAEIIKYFIESGADVNATTFKAVLIYFSAEFKSFLSWK